MNTYLYAAYKIIASPSKSSYFHAVFALLILCFLLFLIDWRDPFGPGNWQFLGLSALVLLMNILPIAVKLFRPHLVFKFLVRKEVKNFTGADEYSYHYYIKVLQSASKKSAIKSFGRDMES